MYNFYSDAEVDNVIEEIVDSSDNGEIVDNSDNREIVDNSDDSGEDKTEDVVENSVENDDDSTDIVNNEGRNYYIGQFSLICVSMIRC